MVILQMPKIVVLVVFFSFLVSGCESLGEASHHDDHSHDDEEHSHDDDDHLHDHDEHNDGGIVFSREYQGKIDFRVDQIAIKELQPSMRVNATINSSRTGKASIIAPFDGRIIASEKGIPEIGSAVRSGDILAYIIPFIQAGEVTQLQKIVEQAEIRFARAQRDHDRILELAKLGAVPERRVIESESELGVLRVDLEQARTQLQQLEGQPNAAQNSSRVAIRSPIDGVVMEQNIVDGMSVTTGTRLSRILNGENLWLEARIPESIIHRMERPYGAWFILGSANGDTTSEIVELDFNDNSRLISMGEEIDSVSRTASVIMAMNEPPVALRPGTIIQANIYHQPAREVSAIPISAVIEEQGMDVVFVMKGQELFERRTVKLGIRDQDYVEVITGLSDDEYVVSQGAYYIRLAAASTEGVGHGHAH